MKLEVHGMLEAGTSLEAQLFEVERCCAEDGCSRSILEGNRPTRDHVVVQLAEEEALP